MEYKIHYSIRIISHSNRLHSRKRDFGKGVLQIQTAKQELPFRQTDMDHLFGKWPEEEFNQIQRGIDEERKIDKGLRE